PMNLRQPKYGLPPSPNTRPNRRSCITSSARREKMPRPHARPPSDSTWNSCVVVNAAGSLFACIVLGVTGWYNQTYLKEQLNWFWTMQPYMFANFRPYVFSGDRERALKPGAGFRECARDCPEVIVVPADSFMMGSPENEKGRFDDEQPQQKITFDRSFA